ncbi:hypothetical protein P3T27_006301 [Kitasatospora sp. MAA19]|nr:hypothetical protein [Kitasatospora sp. MAA19]
MDGGALTPSRPGSPHMLPLGLLAVLLRLTRARRYRHLFLALPPGMAADLVALDVAHGHVCGQSLADHLRIDTVAATVNLSRLEDDLGCGERLLDHGLAIGPDDRRTVAETAAQHLESADVVVTSNANDPDPATSARAVALMHHLCAGRAIRGRGHLWPANRPHSIYRRDSAGEHLAIRAAGSWLPEHDSKAWQAASAQRRTLASLLWDPYDGERRFESTFTGIDVDLPGLHRHAPAQSVTSTGQAAPVAALALAVGAAAPDFALLPHPVASRATAAATPHNTRAHETLPVTRTTWGRHCEPAQAVGPSAMRVPAFHQDSRSSAGPPSLPDLSTADLITPLPFKEFDRASPLGIEEATVHAHDSGNPRWRTCTAPARNRSRPSAATATAAVRSCSWTRQRPRTGGYGSPTTSASRYR